MYLTEMHCHTSEASACAHENAHDTAEKYIAAGYSTIVLTNHYNIDTMWYFDRTKDYKELAKRYIDGYHKLKDEAGDKLNILLGAELKFRGKDKNDYLVYGLTEEFLMEHADIIDSDLRFFYDLAHENGLLIVQAHPFRFGQTIADTRFLDGMEVFNASISVKSHNDIADMWANYYDLIKTSGTDHHNVENEACSGIASDTQIKSNEDLLNVLKSGEYMLIKSELPEMTRSIPRE